MEDFLLIPTRSAIIFFRHVFSKTLQPIFMKTFRCYLGQNLSKVVNHFFGRHFRTGLSIFKIVCFCLFIFFSKSIDDRTCKLSEMVDSVLLQCTLHRGMRVPNPGCPHQIKVIERCDKE